MRGSDVLTVLVLVGGLWTVHTISSWMMWVVGGPLSTLTGCLLGHHPITQSLQSKNVTGSPVGELGSPSWAGALRQPLKQVG